MSFKTPNVKAELRDAVVDLQPRLFITLATNGSQRSSPAFDWPGSMDRRIDRLNNLANDFDQEVGRALLGRQWHRRIERLYGWSFAEQVMGNPHLHIVACGLVSQPLAKIQQEAERAWATLMPAGSVDIAEIGHTWTDQRKIAYYSLKELIDWGDIPSYGPFGRRIHETPRQTTPDPEHETELP